MSGEYVNYEIVKRCTNCTRVNSYRNKKCTGCNRLFLEEDDSSLKSRY